MKRTLFRVVAIDTTAPADETVDGQLSRQLYLLFGDAAHVWPAVGPSKTSNARTGVRVQWDEERPSEEPVWPLGECDAEIDPEEVA